VSARRQAGAILGVGALAALCCIAVPVVLGAVTGAAIGGVAGEIAAALVAVLGAAAIYRRRTGRDYRN
jgi:hypothetical protein